MDILRFRDPLISDYAEYALSFIRVRSDDVRVTLDATVDEQMP